MPVPLPPVEEVTPDGKAITDVGPDVVVRQCRVARRSPSTAIETTGAGEAMGIELIRRLKNTPDGDVSDLAG